MAPFLYNPGVPHLLVVQGALKGRTFPLSGTCVIGRDPAGDIPLPETTASRRHAELTLEGGRLKVRDLKSHNGIWVKGQRVPSAVLVPGESFAVGDHTFLFLEHSIQASTVMQEAGPRRFQLDSAVVETEMVGTSPAFRACLDAAERLAASEAPVLVTGETGTGKELVARWIHRSGPRARGPFVAVNSAAIPEALFEAELFGAEAGAFTGSTGKRAGKFEAAGGGTLFLDEIGELPLALQAKLLRAVQEKAFHRVGGTREVQVDVRIVAATNRDLAAAAREGRFREDLFHRLGTLPLTVPPLRERPEDIPLLARHIAARVARGLGRPFVDLSPSALARLLAYPWPGNVRELQNVVERAVVLSDAPTLGAEALTLAVPGTSEGSFGSSLAEAERETIRRALLKTGGKRGETAKLLGISWPTLRARIRKHGLGE